MYWYSTITKWKTNASDLVSELEWDSLQHRRKENRLAIYAQGWGGGGGPSSYPGTKLHDASPKTLSLETIFKVH